MQQRALSWKCIKDGTCLVCDRFWFSSISGRLNFCLSLRPSKLLAFIGLADSVQANNTGFIPSLWCNQLDDGMPTTLIAMYDCSGRKPEQNLDSFSFPSARMSLLGSLTCPKEGETVAGSIHTKKGLELKISQGVIDALMVQASCSSGYHRNSRAPWGARK
ncbi:hypothetical protein HRR83_003927 [Exophiala dermatitidis]|uniref:Uncharacterized protein n=1 Tax=Exophiala dermatitidis TaxID=5970 RepID=A0AAN6IWD7_EXODE|nr:hypothetical protein HRR74_002688 [Exophiala dermatitidis]KAJ4529434.1 hypothetical protein HRR73_000457 [Exophiala dermatitidis]KAJ4543910.1 hypothetical protein HRR76_001969 [Exophiala dermatitidis]KAJ4549086.1 hypothetical protein HRR77_003964 [Exophiala dermatitidis]KAJ4575376.1 hypothetical protein HRR79_002298 [Exophiala dermatitidis]